MEIKGNKLLHNIKTMDKYIDSIETSARRVPSFANENGT
jgi:hypothetical protein